MDIHSLDRFLEPQGYFYTTALSEIRSGRKRNHWIWFIFPQLRGLGGSWNAHTYGIAGMEEARAYLAHPVLGARLREITGALLALDETNPVAVMGSGIDAMKLCSSMTLFAHATEDNALFLDVLNKFYGGTEDAATLRMLRL